MYNISNNSLFLCLKIFFGVVEKDERYEQILPGEVFICIDYLT